MTFEADPNRYIISIAVDADEVIATLQNLLGEGLAVCNLEPGLRFKRESVEPFRRRSLS